MRVLIQRVTEASVISDGILTGAIRTGLVILLGIEQADETTDADWLVNKITGLRIFSDAEGKMNLSICDVEGDILLVSQFTLHASYQKGNRPSFIRSAKPEKALPLYNYFRDGLTNIMGKQIPSGAFGADMKLHLINDGPVTIWMDSRNRE